MGARRAAAGDLGRRRPPLRARDAGAVPPVPRGACGRLSARRPGRRHRPGGARQRRVLRRPQAARGVDDDEGSRGADREDAGRAARSGAGDHHQLLAADQGQRRRGHGRREGRAGHQALRPRPLRDGRQGQGDRERPEADPRRDRSRLRPLRGPAAAPDRHRSRGHRALRHQHPGRPGRHRGGHQGPRGHPGVRGRAPLRPRRAPAPRRRSAGHAESAERERAERRAHSRHPARGIHPDGRPGRDRPRGQRAPARHQVERPRARHGRSGGRSDAEDEGGDAAPGLPHGVVRALRGPAAGAGAALRDRAARDLHHLHPALRRLPVGARRAAHHAEPAVRADRRHAGPVRVGNAFQHLGCRRLHRGLRRQRAERRRPRLVDPPRARRGALATRGDPGRLPDPLPADRRVGHRGRDRLPARRALARDRRRDPAATRARRDRRPDLLHAPDAAGAAGHLRVARRRPRPGTRYDDVVLLICATAAALPEPPAPPRATREVVATIEPAEPAKPPLAVPASAPSRAPPRA